MLVARPVRAFLRFLLWLTTVALGGWMLLWRSIGDRWGWLGMLNAWAEWGQRGLVAFGSVALLDRMWPTAATALALWALSRRRETAPFRAADPEPHADADIRTGAPLLLTLFGANLYKFNDSVTEHVEMILREAPDILCFQEFRFIHADQLLAALSERYPYHALRPTSGAYGFGVLSRYPVEECGHWAEPGVRPWAQRVRCTLPGDRVIEIYNVHLVPPAADSTLKMGLTWGFRTRESQLRLMKEEIEARGLPAIVIGDHNFADTSDAYGMATRWWRDSWREAGRGGKLTWPKRDFPFRPIPWTPRLLRLDYCFYRGPMVTDEMRVLAGRTGSDHCPIVVRLRVG